MKSKGSCDTCSYYIYDAEYDTYFCDISLDEDEMYKFHGFLPGLPVLSPV